MDKRVGILTFHYVDNYGAVLQAWALMRVINSLPGCSAQIINYVPKEYKIYPYAQTPLAISRMIEKRKKFESFLYKHCGIHAPMIHAVAGNDYDFYCVGSDQVWNLNFRENQDIEYLFPNLDDKAVRFSYAASIGKNSLEQKKKLLYKYLPKFKEISLREQSFIGYIENYYRYEISRVLDPTLLLTAKDYDSLLVSTERKISDKYIFFFVYPIGDEVIKYVSFVNMLARKYHLRIVHTCIEISKYMFSDNAECVMYAGIEEFLSYIKYAEIVVTTSYHGFLFSIIFQKLFYLFIREDGKERLLDIVEILGLRDRVIDDYVSADELSDCIIDYEKVNKVLEMEKAQSMLYLKNVLDIKR